MRLCYQVATPDVAIADSVTAYQGPLEKSFSDLAKLGYKGVELMTLNPSELDWDFVKSEAEKNGLKVVLGTAWIELYQPESGSESRSNPQIQGNH